MRRSVLISFIVIIILTAFALLINLAQVYHLKFDLPNPLTGKEISVNKKIGFAPETYSGFLKRDLTLRRGLDLQGGTSITLRANMKDVPAAERDNALESAKTVIEKRINFYGVSEPVVQTSKVNNDYRIIIEIPGVTDAEKAVQLVGKTAKLTFWEEDPKAGTGEEAIRSATDSAAIQRAVKNGVPIGVIQFFGAHAKKTNLTGSDLKNVAVVFDNKTGKPQVQLSFTSEGGEKFGDITKRNVGKLLAFALDDQLLDAPRVNEPIYGGQAVITGNYTTEQAKDLQIQLNAGALPVSLSVLQQQAIGATLGEVSLQKSLLAGVFGFVVIVVFMVVLYGKNGVIASMALLVYTLLVLALFRLIPVTLTLAGIAGLILSIGIAVDANILIFERMKEELRRGRSLQSAIDLGFSRAWLSIRDSNVASLITSAVLFYFGTGVVKGFAFTLAIGILVSMFSAIFVTRTLLRTFVKK